MTVESKVLESHVSEYLRKIRSAGETLTVCEQSEPVATLSPISKSTKQSSSLIDQLLSKPTKIPGFKPLARDAVYDR